MTNFKRTKIVATLGPVSENLVTITKLIQAGVNVFRLNFSHGSYDEHKRRIELIREASANLGAVVAILQDLQGPKIRCQKFEGGSAELVAGNKFIITADECIGDSNKVSTSYKALPGDVQPGIEVLLDDGKMRLVIDKIEGNDIHTTVTVGGIIKDKKGINVPSAALSTSALSDKDKADLEFGVSLDVDWIALSFVRNPEDMEEARALVKQHGGRQKLIAKIEKPQAIDRFDAILEASDAIMVARGDLGIECPLEEVPLMQKRIISKCIEAGKPVITATQMLDSMEKLPSATRAEATDVANAIFDGTDAVMLSGETAAGLYPVEAASFMARVANMVENSSEFAARLDAIRPEATPTPQDAVANAVHKVSTAVGAKAVVVYTAGGAAVRRVARNRPALPILALTPNSGTYTELSLVGNVVAMMAPDPADTDAMVDIAVQKAKESGFAQEGDYIVVVAGVPFGKPGTTNMIRVVLV